MSAPRLTAAQAKMLKRAAADALTELDDLVAWLGPCDGCPAECPNVKCHRTIAERRDALRAALAAYSQDHDNEPS